MVLITRSWGDNTSPHRSHFTPKILQWVGEVLWLFLCQNKDTILNSKFNKIGTYFSNLQDIVFKSVSINQSWMSSFEHPDFFLLNPDQGLAPLVKFGTETETWRWWWAELGGTMYCSAQIGLVLDHLKFKLTTQNNRQNLITKLYESEFELYVL